MCLFVRAPVCTSVCVCVCLRLSVRAYVCYIRYISLEAATYLRKSSIYLNEVLEIPFKVRQKR